MFKGTSISKLQLESEECWLCRWPGEKGSKVVGGWNIMLSEVDLEGAASGEVNFSTLPPRPGFSTLSGS